MPEVEERGGLSEVIEGERGEAGEQGFAARAEPVLDGLGFERADKTEADSGGKNAAEVQEHKEARGGVVVDAERARDEAENGSKVKAVAFGGGWGRGAVRK